MDHVAEWSTAVGCPRSPESILSYWFQADSHVDLEMLDVLNSVAAAGTKNVIATNNEPRRTAFIENEMGFGTRVERIFSSGYLGCLKPEAAFFKHVSAEIDVSPDRFILIDDNLLNVETARPLGWQTHHLDGGDHDSLKARLRLG